MFLDVLYTEIPADLRLLVYTLPEKRSRWYTDAAKAEADALELSGNVYFGVGLVDIAATEARALETGKTTDIVRATSTEVRALYGLAADVDIVSPGHKKKALYPTVEAAEAFLEELPHRPSAIVRTGGGIQAHWIFREPWIFDGEDDRLLAEATSRGWNAFLRGLARKSGREIDATWDLARVLRIPGTVNAKYDLPVELASIGSRRFNPSDFEPWRQEGGAAGIDVGELVLDPNASPPGDRLNELVSIEPRVQSTLNHTRKELADFSPSAYDQALANWAAAAGWSDQEIADLLLMHRRINKADPKLRQSYYAKTISKARGSVAARELEEDGYSIPSAEAEDRRDELLGIIRAKTGLPVQRILRYGHDAPQWCLILDDGEAVLLGGPRDFLLRPRWEEAAVVAGCASWTRPTDKAWPAVKSAAILATEIVDVVETAPSELMAEWLRELLLPTAVKVRSSEQRFGAIREGASYVEGGRLHFRATILLEALKRRREKIERTELLRRLRELGYSSKLIGARNGDETVSKRYVAVPLKEIVGANAEDLEVADVSPDSPGPSKTLPIC